MGKAAKAKGKRSKKIEKNPESAALCSDQAEMEEARKISTMLQSLPPLEAIRVCTTMHAVVWIACYSLH